MENKTIREGHPISIQMVKQSVPTSKTAENVLDQNICGLRDSILHHIEHPESRWSHVSVQKPKKIQEHELHNKN